MEKTTTEKLHSVKEAASRLGLGLTKIYQEINAGRLTARKCGNRTLVPESAIRQWIEDLPSFRSFQGEGK